MRRLVRLAVVLLSLGLAAAPALALAPQASFKHRAIPGAGRPKANLKGVLAADAKQTASRRPPAVTSAAAAAGPGGLKPMSPQPARPAPAQCRQTCAQTYYFCRASPYDSDCAGTWGQCAAACNR